MTVLRLRGSNRALKLWYFSQHTLRRHHNHLSQRHQKSLVLKHIAQVPFNIQLVFITAICITGFDTAAMSISMYKHLIGQLPGNMRIST